MLDFNSRSALPDRINYLIDMAMPREEKERDYLGASGIGHACERHVQYYLMSVQGTIDKKQPEPRILRIFDRGNVYEDRCRTWLKQAGFIFGRGSHQKGFSDFDGQFKGHVDGILTGWQPQDIVCPIPLPALWENKCLGSKYWKKVRDEHLKAYSPIYYAQVQIYMHYLKLAWCLFCAINADTMEIYHELVPYDPTEAMLCRSRVQSTLSSISEGYMLNRISNTSAYYVCKMCDFRDVCWSAPCQ